MNADNPVEHKLKTETSKPRVSIFLVVLIDMVVADL